MTSGSGLRESRSSFGTDVVSATSGLGGIFGFEVVCRGSLGTGSFAGILECGVLSLGGMLVVCLGAILGTKISGVTVAGSRAGLDLGTSGLRVVLGRRRRW